MKARQLSCLTILCWLASISITFGQNDYGLLPPGIRILSPPNHSVFRAPVDIPIFTYVSDYADTTNVEIYANGIDIGRAYSLGEARPVGPVLPQLAWRDPILRLAPVYCLLWTNPQPGAYALTAVAKRFLTITNTFNPGLSLTSAPVNITVLAPPPPTNGPAIVSIIATDPIAIAGTNSWTWPGPTNITPAWSNWPPARPVTFTNWGPKNAGFLVKRYGNTNDTIVVNYSISGTASNGVDYVELPGYVTNFAGSCYSLIPIIPIDHGPPYLPKTVILTLKSVPTSTAPPPYVVGIPSLAAVVIYEAWPRAFPWLLGDGSFHLNAPGPDGAWFIVQGSSDLLHWAPVCTNQVVAGSIDYIDGAAPGTPYQFYQAVPTTVVPSQ